MALSVIILVFLKAILCAFKTEQNELKPLTVNTMLFYVILCLFCGFEAQA